MALRCSCDSPDGPRLAEIYRKDSDVDPKCPSGGGRNRRRVRSSLSVHIFGLQRQPNRVDVSGPEELRKAHVENTARLERMDIAPHWGEEERERRRAAGDETSVRKLQRIDSQEELDFRETSSGSDLSAEDGGRERTPGENLRRESSLSPEDATTIRRHFGVRPGSSTPDPQRGLLRQRGFAGRPGNSKVTVPRPFQMMLREVRKGRTRSELELENALLRRELDELRECQKKFRASPAPAHVRRPQRDAAGRRAPPPFRFQESERKKREAETAADPAGVRGEEDGRRPVSRSASFAVSHF
ncbi:protein FAM161A-like [Syngnathoides biaculeatus]|uniref:protein FAM161A-like n=1 Tax=Syngnathoides biaculeatus TaxID=300417 RepID=UPI002ADDD74B|nr:protein FAM161A-like [Syngnathoides biaculeatus]